MAIALLTNYLPGYRVPLYERLARRHQLEVLLYGRGEHYAPPWFRDLDAQIAAATFPAWRIGGAREAFGVGRGYDAVIAPFAGGSILPAAFAGAHRRGRPFVLWASVWAAPRSLGHLAALPITRRIYRRADAVIAYGEHVRSFVAGIRGRDSDVFVAPQSVEPELFAREVGEAELDGFRARHELGDGPLVLYVGRFVPEKGVEVLLEAWRASAPGAATLLLVGDGPLAGRARAAPRTRLLGALRRPDLAVAYAAAEFALLPSIPTARFREPWGLVCNEAMHQGRPVIASDSVGAVAGGLVRDGDTGLVVRSGDAAALAEAIERLLGDEDLRRRLGVAARAAVAAYTYDAMVEAFDRALEEAGRGHAGGRGRG
jgi:glycosyltransferase involved in cell wall biosynthesis